MPRTPDGTRSSGMSPRGWFRRRAISASSTFSGSRAGVFRRDGVQVARKLDTVAAIALGRVERLVGGIQDRIEIHSIVDAEGNAGARRALANAVVQRNLASLELPA